MLENLFAILVTDINLEFLHFIHIPYKRTHTGNSITRIPIEARAVEGSLSVVAVSISVTVVRIFIHVFLSQIVCVAFIYI